MVANQDVNNNCNDPELNIVSWQDDDSWGVEWNEAQDGLDEQDPADKPLVQHREHVRNAVIHSVSLTQNEERLIDLCHLLCHKGAPLCTTDAVMEWYLKQVGQLKFWMRPSDCAHWMSREDLFKKLARRCNVALPMHTITPLALPSTDASVNIVHYEASELVVQLLTDPRFGDDSWLHFNDDPLAAPPEDLDYLEDINTGLCYTETHKKKITASNQVLCPIILCDDECVNGQFDKLPLQQIRFTIGLLKNKEREKDYAWKTLGYVPADASKYLSKGCQDFAKSDHAAAHILKNYLNQDLPGDSDDLMLPNFEGKTHKSQDLHAILAVILSSLKRLCQSGMKWDYKHRGKLCKELEFVFFIACIKCDTQEADKLCGHYTSRTKGVKSICRHCTCPTSELSQPTLPPGTRMKTPALITPLVERNDRDGLKNLSQQNLVNCFYDLPFGEHNKMGIHGATPLEMLHHILLGIFPMIREVLLLKLGKDSALKERINQIAKLLGRFFARQSERDLPKTQFYKGLFEGKLCGKEYTGVLLLMDAVFLSGTARQVLKSSGRRAFKEDCLIDDWVLLVELLLQWEKYLKLPRLEIKHVRRLKRKHRFIMKLIERIAKRTSGMGLNTMKFHGIVHLVDDMLNFGVPSTLDTGPNESHHKTPKAVSTMTQKDAKTFEPQVANRQEELHLLDIAKAEVKGRCSWAYFVLEQVRGPLEEKPSIDPNVDWTGGSRLEVFLGDDGNPTHKYVRNNERHSLWDTDVVSYLLSLQTQLLPFGVDRMSICTEHKRGDQIFRGHPNYRGRGMWNDWALFDWGFHGRLPCEIYCFVDLRRVPQDFSIVFASCVVEKAVYAVVESAEWDKSPDGKFKTCSELFMPLKKEIQVDDDTGKISKRRFYLAPVDSIVKPLCVIPDVGPELSRYYAVKPQGEWADEFVKWLEAPHSHDDAELEAWEEEDDVVDSGDDGEEEEEEEEEDE